MAKDIKIRRELLLDNELSLKAKGLLCTLLWKSGGGLFSFKDVMSLSKEGTTALRSAIKELIEKDYCAEVKVRFDNGRFVKFFYRCSDDKEEIKEHKLHWNKEVK